jgi:hypothetical protein
MFLPSFNPYRDSMMTDMATMASCIKCGAQRTMNEPKATNDKKNIIRHLGQFIVLNSYMITALSGKNDGDRRVF